MLEANPLLTPDEVVTLLRETATLMPYEQKVVGSGYVDAHNAVRSAMRLSMVAHPANLFSVTTGGGPQIIDRVNQTIPNGAFVSNSGTNDSPPLIWSGAFFLSIEFQQTGYLVYRTYQAAYGDMPNAPVPIKLNEFKPDTAEIGNGVIVLQSGWQQKLDSNKQAYAEEFVQRSRFTALYPATMTRSEFVDKLFANAGVTPTASDRTAAINGFGTAGTSSDVAARGRVLRRVAENSTLAQQEFNQAFVLMQYFGYLRRNANSGPDTDFSGYKFWLNKLNTFGGNFQNAEMVNAFLVSGEYRGRFPR